MNGTIKTTIINVMVVYNILTIIYHLDWITFCGLKPYKNPHQHRIIMFYGDIGIFYFDD